MKIARFLLGLVTSFILTPVLGLIMPLIGLFIAGFVAGVVASSILLGAATAILGSLPWHVLMSKLLALIASAIGCTGCKNAWILSLAGVAASGAGGAVGGGIVSKLVQKG